MADLTAEVARSLATAPHQMPKSRLDHPLAFGAALAGADALTKYSDTEPRDEDGRWTGGGGAAEDWGSGHHTGPTLGESFDEDDAYERMATSLGETNAHGVGHLEARDVKQIWIANSPLKSIEQVYAGAPANKAELDAAGAEIAQQTGAEYRAPGLKTLGPRVYQKGPLAFLDLMKMAARGNNPAAVTDIVRSTFSVSSPEQANAVAKALADKFPATDEGYKITDEGYFDRAVNVQFKNGQIGEVLIAPPELIAAKSDKSGGGHALYVQRRALPLDDPQREPLRLAQVKIYGDARASLSPAWQKALADAKLPV